MLVLHSLFTEHMLKEKDVVQILIQKSVRRQNSEIHLMSDHMFFFC